MRMKHRESAPEPRVLRLQNQEWVPSTIPGVDRLILDEAPPSGTSVWLTRFQPGVQFTAHDHRGGEEILVLEGVFSDEQGDYPAGTYLRLPPGSHHQPHSDPGCVLFVRLGHFDAADRQRLVVDSTVSRWETGVAPGVQILPLHWAGEEFVCLVRLDPNTEVPVHTGSTHEELFVVEGSLIDEAEELPRWSWLRTAPDTPISRRGGAEGCTFWMLDGGFEGLTASTIR